MLKLLQIAIGITAHATWEFHLLNPSPSKHYSCLGAMGPGGQTAKLFNVVFQRLVCYWHLHRWQPETATLPSTWLTPWVGLQCYLITGIQTCWGPGGHFPANQQGEGPSINLEGGKRMGHASLSTRLPPHLPLTPLHLYRCRVEVVNGCLSYSVKSGK